MRRVISAAWSVSSLPMKRARAPKKDEYAPDPPFSPTEGRARVPRGHEEGAGGAEHEHADEGEGEDLGPERDVEAPQPATRRSVGEAVQLPVLEGGIEQLQRGCGEVRALAALLDGGAAVEAANDVVERQHHAHGAEHGQRAARRGLQLEVPERPQGVGAVGGGAVEQVRQLEEEVLAHALQQLHLLVEARHARARLRRVKASAAATSNTVGVGGCAGRGRRAAGKGRGGRGQREGVQFGREHVTRSPPVVVAPAPPPPPRVRKPRERRGTAPQLPPQVLRPQVLAAVAVAVAASVEPPPPRESPSPSPSPSPPLLPLRCCRCLPPRSKAAAPETFPA